MVNKNESTADRESRTIEPRVPSKRHTPNSGGALETIEDDSQEIDQVTSFRTNIGLSPWPSELGTTTWEYRIVLAFVAFYEVDLDQLDYWAIPRSLPKNTKGLQCPPFSIV